MVAVSPHLADKATMFWRKATAGKPGAAADADRFNVIGVALLDAAQLDFDNSSQLHQALTGTFLFGMLYAEGMSQKLSASEIKVQAVSTFQKVLHYTPEAADQGVQHCIEATAPGGHDTMRAILHRGIDGHRQYLDGDMQGLGENLISILGRFAGHLN